MHTTIISSSEAGRLRDDTLFFDCRHNLFNLNEGADNYTASHLPNAYHLHIDNDLSGEIIPQKTGRHPLPDMDDFAVFISRFGLHENTQVVCYDDKGGGLAARLWWMLRVLGHEAVAVLDGGIQAWTAAGLPLESGYRAHPVAEGNTIAPHLAPYSPLCTRDRAQTDALRNDPNHTVIDSRTAARYRGEEEPIDPVAGHIEGAINLPWPENLEGGKLKSKTELKARFSTLEKSADKNVFYCGSGVTACHNILAYTYAYGEMPLLYPGSWSEWLISGTRN
jgi:thiosulfate/3-mercaptopyruvate sulfurtransferase